MLFRFWHPRLTAKLRGDPSKHTHTILVTVYTKCTILTSNIWGTSKAEAANPLVEVGGAPVGILWGLYFSYQLVFGDKWK